MRLSLNLYYFKNFISFLKDNKRTNLVVLLFWLLVVPIGFLMSTNYEINKRVV
ncbi:hypothetical protein BCN_1911 [Bacillus cereus NC7401]|nr:hypothetical protein BCN_1911 [Bacillus cereus NC7401]